MVGDNLKAQHDPVKSSHVERLWHEFGEKLLVAYSNNGIWRCPTRVFDLSCPLAPIDSTYVWASGMPRKYEHHSVSVPLSEARLCFLYEHAIAGMSSASVPSREIAIIRCINNVCLLAACALVHNPLAA